MYSHDSVPTSGIVAKQGEPQDVAEHERPAPVEPVGDGAREGPEQHRGRRAAG